MSMSRPLSVGPSDGHVRRTCPADGPLVCPRKLSDGHIDGHTDGQISPSSETKMHEVLRRLKGVACTADDVLIYGCGHNVEEGVG
jgi:hypothetical protein